MKAQMALPGKAASLLVLLAAAVVPTAQATPSGYGLAGRATRPLTTESLERGNHGTWMESCAMLTSSPAEWDACMAGMAGRGALEVTPPPAAPEVDWSRSTVLLVSLGKRPAGWDVEVIGVRRQGDRAIVQVDVRRPAPDQNGMAWSSAPYEIVRIDATGFTGVDVRYGWSSASVPLFSTASVSAGIARVPASSGSGDPDHPGVSRGVSWGELKGMYR